ncbi:hypothetical protein IU450_37730 [Nocardia abscessus]|uniref:hypothetical protein n=1 Tax=Nocardia abscessus TaxID=120957 RepID=UPI001892EBFC|nr:hypothetical protein [Nocardia abscessus]MBF6341578.1 hypothetical protein [Nocardia abscessus]
MTSAMITELRLPRLLAARPDPARTLEQARFAVNLLRWRATLSALFRDYDRVKADQHLTDKTRELALVRLLDSINAVVVREPLHTDRLELPSREPPALVETTQHYLEALILAANRIRARGVLVEDLVRRWLSERSSIEAIAALDGDRHSQLLYSLDTGSVSVRDAVTTLASAWLFDRVDAPSPR